MKARIIITTEVGEDEIIGIKDYLSDVIEDRYTVEKIEVEELTGEQTMWAV